MITYKLTIWWWLDGARTNGGDYFFVASDDETAISRAHDKFDEQITMADQSSIFQDDRLIWENEWPVPEGGRT